MNIVGRIMIGMSDWYYKHKHKVAILGSDLQKWLSTFIC